MNDSYPRTKINQLLLTKKMDEIYLAIIERNPLSLYGLDKEEYENIYNDYEIVSKNKYEVEELLERLKDKNNQTLNDSKIDLLNDAKLRRLSIVTTLYNNIYDIRRNDFIDLDKEKIVDYLVVSYYVSDETGKMRYIRDDEARRKKVDPNTVIFELPNERERYFESYENKHITDDLIDLTDRFLIENKCKRYYK